MLKQAVTRLNWMMVVVALAGLVQTRPLLGQPYLDNETQYSNQDPNNETRRSEHFRLCFGHFNRDTGTPMTEQLAQGNLQMYEQMWRRWITEMGLMDLNTSATDPAAPKRRANFNFLMTWNDGGGGGAYSSMDGSGYFYAMANSGYTRFDPPSGATPHEFGHVWEGTAAGFNGSDSSGAWWECTANWLQLQFLNSYPQAGAYIYNGIYYPTHGRDYYDSFTIWETALEDPRYGAGWVNAIWTNATPQQKSGEYILDRMIRLDASGSADKAGGMKDLWGDMAKKMITWDFRRQRWLATVNRPDDGSNWEFYQRCRTPLTPVPGVDGWYRPSRAHLPMQFGFNFIPLAVSSNSTVSCIFQPHSDPVRQSDWRACLVAVNAAGEAAYSTLWNTGTNSITLSADQARCYLVVIATPRPMKIADPAWRAYLTDAGLQFPYRVSFVNAAPRNVIYPPQNRAGMTQHANGGGWKANTAAVDASAWLGPNAQVLNSAQVRGTARIEDYAVVKDSARVTNAVVSGHAVVEGNARVYGNARVRDWARVFGHAEVFENARVIEHANCGDGNATTHTRVYGNAVVKGTTYVYDPSTFAGSLIVDGDSANGNGSGSAAVKGVHFGWAWGQDPGRFNGLADNQHLFARHAFDRTNAVFAMDEYGINHGYLMNGARTGVDAAAPARGGWVLPLDGAGQYVELHPAVNDFRDASYTLWFKWGGGAVEQHLWSMGNGSNRVMTLTVNDPAGGLRLALTDGVTTETLDAGAMTPNTWTHVAAVFSAGTVTLYINGAVAAYNPAATLFPDSLNAPLMHNANYLGRGNAGGYFAGSLDDFRAYMRALDAAEVFNLFTGPAPAPVTLAPDTTAPAPNAATWLVPPTAIADTGVTMSATPGTDASGWVEYYFDCVSGPGHDSGWVSFNKYFDMGLPTGAAVTYTVRMRDRNGNMTAASAPQAATCAVGSLPAAVFSYGPIGIADGQITMSATLPTNLNARIEYKFDRVSPTAASSGWQSSPTWTQTGLTAGSSYSYTVTLRDGHGNQSAPSGSASATAWDAAAPRLAFDLAHWEMMPYATIDNKISMTAQSATDASGIQYQFECVSGGGPSSGWQSSRTFVTSVLPDGTYVYRYRTRDTSARANTSGYSMQYPATITPTSGYHAYPLSQVVTLPDDYLVSFPATVLKVYSNYYWVRDLASGAAIKVRPATSNQVTSAALALKNVQVSGHLYTFAGIREVTFSTLAATGDPVLYTISGRVTNTLGGPVGGATVYFSDVPGASSNAVVTATTDAVGNYSRGVVSGNWHVAAGASAFNSSPDRLVNVNGGAVTNINFGLVPNARVYGRVTRRSDGAGLSGATVYFSRQPGAAGSPVFTTSTDMAGQFQQAVQDGVWHVAAGSTGYYVASDKTIQVFGQDVTGIDFSLQPSTRTIPQQGNLLFSVVTDSLPNSGNTGPWPTYLPAGQTLSTIGSPSVELLSGVKWEKNIYAEGDGYRQARYATPLRANGITIVAAVRPNYLSVGGEARGEIVDIFYDRLALAVGHNDGRLMVARGYWNDWGPAIPNGQKTVVSLVVQPNGAYKAYTNGVQAMSGGAFANFTNIPPDHTVAWGNNTWANDPDFTHYINVGRNDPDGWSAFSGHLGDIFVYTNALPDADRVTLEEDLKSKFLSASYTITATAGAGGYINPLGSVVVPPGGTQSFTITPQPGYTLTNLVVNGVSQGAVNSWTFNNVAANHSISAAFAALPATPPTLAIALNGSGGIDITWPDSYSGQLLSSPVVGAGAVWTPVGIPPVTANGVKRVTITPGATAAFYGLSQ